MSDICGDNRFEIIAEAKSDLLEYTNINDSPEEMAVLDSFLFRCWQMGWLKKYELNEFEWCTDCKEYDQEKHCCHRWTKVIKQTVQEVKRQYALEYPKIIHCEDCKWWNRLEDGHPYGDCRACRSGTHTERWNIHIQRQCKFDFYCADAEPKEEEDNDE